MPLTKRLKRPKEITSNEIREVTTLTPKIKLYVYIQRIVRKCYEQLHTNKLDNLDEIHKFLETYNLSKLNQEVSENPNRQITPSEIEAVVRKTPNKQKHWIRWL